MSSPHLILTLQHLISLRCLNQSFSNMNLILNSWNPSKVQNISSPEDTEVLFPKNSKFFYHKRCLDYTFKHSRWLIWFYKPKPNKKFSKWTLKRYTSYTKKPHILHQNVVFLYLTRAWSSICKGSDLSSKSLHHLQKQSQSHIWNQIWTTCNVETSDNINGKLCLMKIMSQQIFVSNPCLEWFKPVLNY